MELLPKNARKGNQSHCCYRQLHTDFGQWQEFIDNDNQYDNNGNWIENLQDWNRILDNGIEAKIGNRKSNQSKDRCVNFIRYLRESFMEEFPSRYNKSCSCCKTSHSNHSCKENLCCRPKDSLCRLR